MGTTVGIPFPTPGHIEFSWQDQSQTVLEVEVGETDGDAGLRQVDSYMLAVIAAQESEGKRGRVSEIRVNLSGKTKKAVLESFKRRLSYHAMNRGWKIQLAASGNVEPLYAKQSDLLSPGPDEVVHVEFKPRTDSTDRDGSTEKMLQTWLAGSSRKTGHRLAIFGEDFIFDKKHQPAKVIREFPTGVFNGVVRKGNRRLPTYWVDLVTLNRAGRLALIELKISDKKLDILAQALDYALYFRTYWPMLVKTPELEFASKRKGPIEVYFVSNLFHPQFDSAAGYLSPCKSTWGFQFKKIVLGVKTDL